MDKKLYFEKDSDKFFEDEELNNKLNKFLQNNISIKTLSYEDCKIICNKGGYLHYYQSILIPRIKAAG